ncbi:hypothetical protein KQI41_08055 [Tissierella pigra]|uniref:Uncharacterized protein n=1 Tax=Tissierella pigra TaxID=2607614 RepID=A0A6N7XN10_9FIRM|nr:hypothetical protein [Tissierella pigra]MBU5426367.1 hypothetical protein [Tissierella pigra]MSU02192.1 hypothetical protein [Tissierella pigra]
MIIGIFFILISGFIYIKEKYNVVTIEGERVFNKKIDIIQDGRYRYSILISILSFILGIFSILSSIIY